MFRVGALVLIALVLSLFFGCSDKTSDVKPTGLELGFQNCITFNADVFIDNAVSGRLDYMGSFSTERAWFIELNAGTHTLEVHTNIVVVAPNTSFCWTQNFNVADGQITHIDLDCDTGICPASE